MIGMILNWLERRKQKKNAQKRYNNSGYTTNKSNQDNYSGGCYPMYIGNDDHHKHHSNNDDCHSSHSHDHSSDCGSSSSSYDSGGDCGGGGDGGSCGGD